MSTLPVSPPPVVGVGRVKQRFGGIGLRRQGHTTHRAGDVHRLAVGVDEHKRPDVDSPTRRAVGGGSGGRRVGHPADVGPAGMPLPVTARPLSVATIELSFDHVRLMHTTLASVRAPAGVTAVPSRQVPAGWAGVVWATQLSGRSTKGAKSTQRWR